VIVSPSEHIRQNGEDSISDPAMGGFQDGCVHDQIDNRCANAWDARIFWTTCQAGPHR
jgi:hypothetical protein